MAHSRPSGSSVGQSFAFQALFHLKQARQFFAQERSAPASGGY